MNQTEIEKFRIYAKKQLEPTGWWEVLKTFINSIEFDKLLIELWKEVQNGYRFTPQFKDVFNAFERCPYNELKVVMCLQDPYPKIHTANGVAMCCENTGMMQQSLHFVFEAISRELGTPKRTNPSLREWANQGVLLINSALTTRIDNPGKHYKIWEPFISYVIDTLSINNKNLVWVFMGSKAQEYMSLVDDSKHIIYTTSHPVSAGYKGLKEWDSRDVFKNINQSLNNYGKNTINWG